MALSYLEIDVFGSSGPVTGNPVAVVLGADGLDDATMRAVAGWTGTPETCFLVEPTELAADYRVRIFTPLQEVPFAGHPTLGSARAWLATGRVPQRRGSVVQQCGLGLVEVRVEGERLAFAAPPRTRTGALAAADVARACELLGIAIDEVVDHAWGSNGPEWRILQLASAEAVRSVRLRGDRQGFRFGLVGLEAPDAEIAYEVRAFGDSGEDPVTGSLHASVAQWLLERKVAGGRWVASQGSQVGRRGRVHLHDDGERLWVGGRAAVVVRGEIELGGKGDATPQAVTAGGLDRDELLAQLSRRGVELNPSARELVQLPDFDSPTTVTVHPLVRTVAELGLADGASLSSILQAVTERGFELVPLVAAPWLRLAMLDQAGASDSIASTGRAPSGSLTIASPPPSGDDDVPKGFYLRVIDGVPWLRGYRCDDEHPWSGDDAFLVDAPPNRELRRP